MKRLLLFLTLLFFYSICYSQKFESENWIMFQEEELTTLKFTKSETIKYNDFLFDVKWQDSLSYSRNIGYYGGVSELKISFKGKYLQMIKNIEDGIGLGEIRVAIYDYNMDGVQDFSIQRDCGKTCYEYYYLFDKVSSVFIHEKEWDYIRIQSLNKVKKEILTVPDGTALKGDYDWFQVKGNKLKLIKKMYYGN